MGVKKLTEAVNPILTEQIRIINVILVSEEMLTIECTCYFKGLPVLWEQGNIKDGGLT